MDYLDEIIDVIQRIAEGDFSARVEIKGDNDNINSIANGINMLAEEIGFLFEKREKYESKLQCRINDLKSTVDFISDTEMRMIDMMREIDDLRKRLNMPTKYF